MSDTKQKIIKTAFNLFHERGIKAVSVDEILEQSETGKGQFYHHFGSKDGLIEAVLEDFENFLKTTDCPLKHDIKSWKDLENFFKFFIEAVSNFDEPRACPVGLIGSGLSDEQDEIRALVTKILDYGKSSLVGFFEEAKANGDFNGPVNSEALADFCQSMIQGGLLMAKIKKDISPLENTVKHIIKYLKSLRS